MALRIIDGSGGRLPLLDAVDCTVTPLVTEAHLG